MVFLSGPYMCTIFRYEILSNGTVFPFLIGLGSFGPRLLILCDDLLFRLFYLILVFKFSLFITLSYLGWLSYHSLRIALNWYWDCLVFMSFSILFKSRLYVANLLWRSTLRYQFSGLIKLLGSIVVGAKLILISWGDYFLTQRARFISNISWICCMRSQSAHISCIYILLYVFVTVIIVVVLVNL